VIVYYAAMSMDGRIADAEHGIGFLQLLPRGPERDYEDFYDGVDSLIMGARTWDFMVRHGSWPYGGKPTWVVTNAAELAELPGAEPIERYAGPLPDLVRQLADRGLERTWLVGGGDLAGQLLEADLLDELILTVAPTLVGNGPALAEGAFPLRQFRLTEVSQWGEEGARLQYERAPRA
jgi:dihydrofolate reductase